MAQVTEHTDRRSEMSIARLDDRLLSADEVAELLGMSAYWVREQTRKRKIPFVALGPKVRKYRRSSLQAGSPRARNPRIDYRSRW